MSESFSLCETEVPNSYAMAEEGLAEQAAAQGITFVAATGDAGAAGCDDASESTETGGLAVGLPASTPFTTAVGGTELNENNDNNLYWNSTTGDALKYIPEDVWNESCSVSQCGSADANLAAGGGGVSVVFPKPSYQMGITGNPSDGARDVPDVAFSAAGHDGYIICLDGSCADPNNISLAVISGTSAGTPSFAGVMSLVDQKTASRQGLANVTLYHLFSGETLGSCNASTLEPGTPPASTCIFNDVTVGNNSVPGETGYPNGVYAANVGYDPASGLGSINVENLVNKWSTFTRTATTTTLSISPTSLMHGANPSPVANGTVTGNGGTPTGDVAFVADGTSLASVDGVTISGGNFNGTALTDLPGGGPYNVVARYGGDGTFAPSTSSAVSVTVTPEPSSVAMAAFLVNVNNGNYSQIPQNGSVAAGSLVYVSATVNGNSGQGIPTGTVTITDASASDGGTLTLNSLGFAEIQTTTFSSGSHSFSASYSGDPSFNASSSTSPVAFTITGSTGGGTFSVSASPSSATATPGSPASTTITATGSGGFAGSVALSASVTGPTGAIDPPSCSFGTNPIPLSASTTSGMSSMSCSTTAASEVIYVPLRGPNRPIWLALGASLAIAHLPAEFAGAEEALGDGVRADRAGFCGGGGRLRRRRWWRWRRWRRWRRHHGWRLHRYCYRRQRLNLEDDYLHNNCQLVSRSQPARIHAIRAGFLFQVSSAARSDSPSAPARRAPS